MLTEVLTDAEQHKVHAPTDEWSDSFALKVAKADFEAAEIYRTNNHDKRWQLADDLYFGWEKQRVWEGTKIPRSSLGMFVVFSQIESLLPKVLSSIFADTPWFEVGPQPGTSGIQAMQARDLILYQMERGRKLQNQSVREVFRRAIKSACIYGAGIIELCWMDETKTRKRFSREMVPVTQQTMHPVYGRIELPTGQQRQELVQKEVEVRHQMPFMKYVSIKDFYIDPHCPGPQVQQARYACTRAYMTVDQLEAKRGKAGFTIPAKEVLLELAKHKPHAQSDVTKAHTETARLNSYQPQMDYSSDPGAGRVEIICYWTEDRYVWMANREHILYNEVNPYGFIPFFNAFYTDALDRFYGLSVTDVTEGEHRLQASIINARIDELSLTINSTRIKRRGIPIPQHQLRRRPGQIIEAEDPKNDIVTEQTQNITQPAYIEVDASQGRVNRTMGMTELFSYGGAAGGGNSASRTATGIGAQQAAGASRVVYFVENNEDTFVEPILSAWHTLNTIFLDPNDLIKIFGEQSIDPINILNADVLFTMRASSKMQSRMALMQTFPLLAQTVLNPEFIGVLNRQGLTVDMVEVMTMLTDMSGYKSRGQIIRALSEQEQAALQAAAQQEVDAELIKQRERMADMKEMTQAKLQSAQQIADDANTSDMTNTILKTGLEAALEPEETPA